MNDSIEIPIENLESTGVSGVYRVNPNPEFLAWITNQRRILLVQPTKERYEQLKKTAIENPESEEAKIFYHPDNQDLFKELED